MSLFYPEIKGTSKQYPSLEFATEQDAIAAFHNRFGARLWAVISDNDQPKVVWESPDAAQV